MFLFIPLILASKASVQTHSTLIILVEYQFEFFVHISNLNIVCKVNHNIQSRPTLSFLCSVKLLLLVIAAFHIP